ncbi:hypothetical protein FIBSPDRAFT_821693 [Athelia psychrophila]|uniref:AN1-type domain-containing protein n=1 Tax=Athelia psychrophila TaxID=1759441 RepID=A0A166NCA3_9AGAM|nr:hypothetical protein FIBSPDRAFT_821693 [Fibularhizoctonia sp. CBS 109695]
MDLPHIGAHCALSTCNDLDLLPIRCNCEKLFCRHHIAPDKHECHAQLLHESKIPIEPWAKSERCAMQACNKLTLASANAYPSDVATCSRCHKAFCASHRYADTHACSAPEIIPPKKNEAAQKLLAKHFPSANAPPSSSRTIRAPKDPKKRAQLQKIEMMKMRHHAVPGDPKDTAISVMIDQRLHVKIKLEDPDYPSNQGIFWFRKNVGTGKALDNLTMHFGIPPSDLNRRQLVKTADQEEECIVLRNDQTLSEQVEDGFTLTLTRMA